MINNQLIDNLNTVMPHHDVVSPAFMMSGVITTLAPRVQKMGASSGGTPSGECSMTPFLGSSIDTL